MRILDYLPLLVGLTMLLLGLTVGKAWERYKLRDGTWVDRRRARDSPHYILGLNFLVANQIDQAVEELSQAAGMDADALETHMILGNLYRERGQVGRAIQVHQQLLQRPSLSKLEHGYVLLCLGLDFRRGGFIGRALEAFNEVLRLDPKNRYALLNLEKLHEEQQQWTEAYAIREQLIVLGGDEPDPRDAEIQAFLEHQIGLEALKAGDQDEAARRFRAAIDRDAATVPAYLSLGDLRAAEGNDAGAVDAWQQVVTAAPDRAYLAFDRLAGASRRLGTPERFARLCEGVIAQNPQDWRARQALAQHLADVGEPPRALELLFDALSHAPHALTVHQGIWHTLSRLDLPKEQIRRYVELTRDAVFYLDPHVCTRCRYRSTELLWHCPHCHEWNTFVEEWIAPADERTERRA
jgi:lipopolysaccharide biosynthesis regulator YciM